MAAVDGARTPSDVPTPHAHPIRGVTHGRDSRSGGFLLAVVAAMLGAGLPSVRGEDVDEDYAAELPRIPPRSPDEALAAFRVADGFEVRLVAAEPQVVDPVAIAFDERLRLWAIEMRGYSEWPEDRLGRVRLLADDDADGRYESSTVFLDGLSWPTAIACWNGGVFIGVAPDILWAVDHDGDGRADFVRRVATGFGRGNVQGLLNGLVWGLDHRLHVATSSSGVRLGVVGSDAAPVDAGRRDVSFDPRSLEFHVLGDTAQHGLSFDDQGRKFVCSNSDHLQMVVYDSRYAIRTPEVAAPSVRASIAADGGQAEVHRASPVEPWRIVRTRLRVAGAVPGPVEGGGRAAGYFTGSTGVTIVRSEDLGELDGCAIIGDVGSNIVHRKRLVRDGALLRGERIDTESELVASSDIWFRPVTFANGPDGALYIVDMCREVIEHPASLPPMIKKHLDLASGRDRGRIWKIVRRGSDAKAAPLHDASPADLVRALGSGRGQTRDTAARLLYERRPATVAGDLRALARQATSGAARIASLASLAALDVLDEPTLVTALGDVDPGVRENAVRLAESRAVGSPTLRARLLAMVEDEDARVRLQLAFTLGEIDASGREAALASLLIRDGGSSWMRFAVATSTSRGAGGVFDELARREASADALESFAGRIALAPSPDAIGSVLRFVDAAPRDRAAPALRGLLRGLERSDPELARKIGASGRAGDVAAELTASALVLVSDRAREPADRVAALASLPAAEISARLDVLAALLDPAEPAEVGLAALRAFERSTADGATLVDAWSRAAPAVRGEIVEVLLRSLRRRESLLSAIESGQLPVAVLDAPRRKQLRDTSSAEERDRVDRLLDGVELEPRAAVVARAGAILEASGDRTRGRRRFVETCSPCHRLEGVGQELGPNLASVAARGREALLLGLLDPNREVDAQYAAWTAVTHDARVVTGRVVAEGPTSITLVRAGGVTEVVRRGEIATLESGGVSLMPEGLEETLGDGGIADVIAYIAGLAELPVAPAATAAWRAGVARRVITPDRPMWLSGYSSRTRPAQETLLELHAKSVAIEDPGGARAILVTLDLIGIPRDLSLDVRREIERRHGIPRSAIVLACSHTHTGPVVKENLAPMYFLSAEDERLLAEYARRLRRLLLELADEALGSLRPADLRWTNGTADFAVNRRNNPEPRVPELREAGALEGPVDHDVPVLSVEVDGRQAAVVFGYACHATVLSADVYSGDYPGFAQAAYEDAHPGTVALFWAGCGGDQNPLPRRTVELARHYGQRLARSVDDALSGPLRTIGGRLATAYREIDLAFASVPDASALDEARQSTNRYEARRALLLSMTFLDSGSIPSSYPYPVQVWRWGDGPLQVILGGEVVVDYSVRIKRELGRDTTWVTAYSNDVMAYIPSERVLAEGGYEGATSMIYYGLPSPWATGIEEKILSAVHALAKETRAEPEASAR